MGFIKKYKWYKVAASVAGIDCGSAGITEVEVDGKTICLGQFNDEWYGFASNCPHAGAAMLDGYINGACQVVCAVHQLRFSLKTGLDSNGEGYKLKTYPVEVREDGVYVGLEEPRFKLF
jgi:3-phenylpropionate/trans-cinnamate dioxygenase ferredoxin subunit